MVRKQTVRWRGTNPLVGNDQVPGWVNSNFSIFLGHVGTCDEVSTGIGIGIPAPLVVIVGLGSLDGARHRSIIIDPVVIVPFLLDTLKYTTDRKEGIVASKRKSNQPYFLT